MRESRQEPPRREAPGSNRTLRPSRERSGDARDHQPQWAPISSSPT
jgi:hypothetical protein